MSFASDIEKWCKETPERVNAVRKRAIELLADEMTTTNRNGGKVPFKDGNLAKSLLASTQGMPKTSETPVAGENIGLVTATLQPDQPVWLGYQAIYARRMNYGFVGADSLGRVFNQEGHYFVEGAIAKWPEFVKEASEEIFKEVNT